MLDSTIAEKCLSWAVDKGLIFISIFILAGGALTMESLFGYPLDWPHRIILFSLLLFVCVYGHYSLKAIRLWMYLRNPSNYREEVYEEVIAIRQTVREIIFHSPSAAREDWQKWDDRFHTEHLSMSERQNEWQPLQPIVMAVRNLRLASFLDNNISVDEGAIMKAYKDIESYGAKYLEATSWAQRK